MLEKLLGWADESDTGPGGGRASARPTDRADPRHGANGFRCVIRFRGQSSSALLRDVSASSASCISDLPLPKTGMVWLEVEREVRLLAQIRWVRNSTVGVKFRRPLETAVLDRLLHRARRKR